MVELSAAPEEYFLTGTCDACGHVSHIPLSRREAAFFHVIGPEFRCVACGAKEAGSQGHSIPSVDAGLIEEWLQDEELAFLDQDEELILAEAAVRDLVTAQAAAKNELRRAQLSIALAIKLYDESFEGTAERATCIDWLRRNRDAWQDTFDYDYVSRAVAERLDAE